MQFHWITVVWGKSYTEVFTNLSVPSQLSPKNLPALRHRDASIYKIYAPRAEIEFIRASGCFARLASLIPVQFIEILNADPERLRAWPYDFMASCHKHAYEEAVAADAATIFLAPDIVLCDGAFSAIERRALEGFSLLLTSSLHATIEDGRPWIEEQCLKPDGSILLTARQAVAMTRKHPQSSLEKMVATAPEYSNRWPSYLWMPVNQNSMVYRAWHLHPILVRNPNCTNLVDAIDSGHFYEDALARGDTIYLFKDSEEFCLVELSPYRQRLDNKEEGPFSVDEVSKWVEANTGPASRVLAKQSLVYDGGDVDVDAIADADRVLTDLVGTVLARTTRSIQKIERIHSASEIDRARPTYFFGSGVLGQRLMEEIDSLSTSWDFRGFIDSYKSGICGDFPVLDLKQFQTAYQPGDQVVITSMYVPQISKTLASLGVNEVKDATGWYRARQHSERLAGTSLSRLPVEQHRGERSIDLLPKRPNQDPDTDVIGDLH